MSSLTRRMQRSQKHTEPHHDKKRGWHRVSVGGRPKPFMGRGSQLGVSNPRAKDRLAREARDRKWGRGK